MQITEPKGCGASDFNLRQASGPRDLQGKLCWQKFLVHAEITPYLGGGWVALRKVSKASLGSESQARDLGPLIDSQRQAQVTGMGMRHHYYKQKLGQETELSIRKRKKNTKKIVF